MSTRGPRSPRPGTKVGRRGTNDIERGIAKYVRAALASAQSAERLGDLHECAEAGVMVERDGELAPIDAHEVIARLNSHPVGRIATPGRLQAIAEGLTGGAALSEDDRVILVGLLKRDLLIEAAGKEGLAAVRKSDAWLDLEAIATRLAAPAASEIQDLTQKYELRLNILTDFRAHEAAVKVARAARFRRMSDVIYELVEFFKASSPPMTQTAAIKAAARELRRRPEQIKPMYNRRKKSRHQSPPRRITR